MLIFRQYAAQPINKKRCTVLVLDITFPGPHVLVKLSFKLPPKVFTKFVKQE